MQLALAQVSTLSASFEADVADYAAGKCPAIELWLGKLETYLERHTPDDVLRLLDEHHVRMPVAAFQGGLLTSQGEYRRQHWEDFRRRLELCKKLGVQTLIVAADIAGPLAQQDLDRAAMSLAEMAKEAGARGVRVALEFQSRSTFVNNLQTAAAVVAEVSSPHLGICFDAFHYYTGPSKLEDWAYLSPANLFHVQLCDLSGTARELATDADRVLPGDGDFSLGPIVEHLRAINYSGYVSIELMNPHIWQIPPRQFGEIAMTALRKLVGEAHMGGPST